MNLNLKWGGACNISIFLSYNAYNVNNLLYICAMIIGDLQKALEELQKVKDLKKFQGSQKSMKFCKKYNITEGNLNFLLSVVAAERIKEKKIL